MRTILPIVTFVIFSGCAGTPKVQPPAPSRVGSSPATPAVSELPSLSKLSEEMRRDRQQRDEMAYKDLTKVQGNLTR
jgi:hypothetical protein